MSELSLKESVRLEMSVEPSMFVVEELQGNEEVRKLLDGLILREETIDRIRRVFISEMELALNMKPSSLQMENTYIPELLDGTESGIYLAMDLGGTNLRMMLVELAKGQVASEFVHHYPLSDDIRIGCGDRLFDYLGECVLDFTREKQLRTDIKYPLGFTFSFPMRQHSLDSGFLVTWTKTFNCPSAVNQDAVQLLRQSLAKCGCNNVEVLAILNDTTGTLMHGALLDRRTRVATVVGTGSNGSYMERASRVKHWEQQRHGEHHVIIDVEWGAFGDNGVLDFIKTEFDRIVDNGSLLRGSFTFEKYISGKYLGELCRVILQELHARRLFLPTLSDDHLPLPWTFGSDNVSLIESHTLQQKPSLVKALIEQHYRNAVCTDNDARIAQYVCGVISHRAAQLVAINVSALLNRMDDELEITIATDGSVYKHHPRLRHWLHDYTRRWAPSKNCTFMLAEDGSGKGAALVAAIADKLRKRGC